MIADYIEQHDNLDNECAERNELRGSQLHVITPSERLRGTKEAPSCLLGKDEGLTAYRVLLWQRLLDCYYTVNAVICQTNFYSYVPVLNSLQLRGRGRLPSHSDFCAAL